MTTRCQLCASCILLAAMLLGLPESKTDNARAGRPSATGSISGTIRFSGTVPPAKKILTSDGGTLIHNDLVVHRKNLGLRSVFVLLEDGPVQKKLKDARPVLVDQRDMAFLPRVVAVQHGQPVRFENNDLCNHSVQASSTVPANQLNVVAVPNQPVTHVFEPQKTPVQIGCALHGWMRAWVFVVAHPWYAVSDEQGKFRINNVPPGKHTLLLIHADSNMRERRNVEIQMGKNQEVTVDWKKLK